MNTMNRCYLIALTLLALAGAVAEAQTRDPRRDSAVVLTAPETAASGDTGGQRVFPRNAMRASLVVTAAPDIEINGKPDRLSPGARIRSVQNTLVLPANLMGQKLLVNYTREPSGMVHEVWILNELEARQKLPTQQKPAAGVVVDDGKTPYNQLPKW
jgi:hypothetical protein